MIELSANAKQNMLDSPSHSAHPNGLCDSRSLHSLFWVEKPRKAVNRLSLIFLKNNIGSIDINFMPEWLRFCNRKDKPVEWHPVWWQGRTSLQLMLQIPGLSTKHTQSETRYKTFNDYHSREKWVTLSRLLNFSETFCLCMPRKQQWQWLFQLVRLIKAVF